MKITLKLNVFFIKILKFGSLFKIIHRRLLYEENPKSKKNFMMFKSFWYFDTLDFF